MCREVVNDDVNFRRFEQDGREVILHPECIALLIDIIRAGLGEVKVLEEIQEQTVRERILKMVQRDADGLFVISSKNIYDLAAREAVALVLYIEARPLSTQEIADRLKRCYKEILSSSFRVYLTARDTTTSIRLYITRTDSGYELNPAGVRWFETNVAPSIIGDINNYTEKTD